MGALRFALAILVAVGHLADTGQIAFLAVFGFYLISGFLITRVLNDVYRFQAVPFAMNRALRLMPMYYAVLLVTLGVICLWPDAAASFKQEWNLATVGKAEVVSNAFIVPYLYAGLGFRLVPPSWSLAVEIACYGLLWLIVARRPAFAVAALAFAVVYHLRSLGLGETFGARYSPVSAAMLPFSLGALIYFGTRDRNIEIPALPVLLGWIAVIVLSTRVPTEGHAWDVVFYLNVALIFGTVLCLSQRRFGSLDRMLGELSYPVFLMHWLIGFMLSDMLGNRSIMLAVASIPIAIGASLALIWASNAVVEPIRDAIRSRAKRAETGQLAAQTA